MGTITADTADTLLIAARSMAVELDHLNNVDRAAALLVNHPEDRGHLLRDVRCSARFMLREYPGTDHTIDSLAADPQTLCAWLTETIAGWRQVIADA